MAFEPIIEQFLSQTNVQDMNRSREITCNMMHGGFRNAASGKTYIMHDIEIKSTLHNTHVRQDTEIQSAVTTQSLFLYLHWSLCRFHISIFIIHFFC